VNLVNLAKNGVRRLYPIPIRDFTKNPVKPVNLVNLCPLSYVRKNIFSPLFRIPARAAKVHEVHEVHGTMTGAD